MGFDQNIRTKVLLWCDRHCCLCKKACDVNIEVHHIIPEAAQGSSTDIDNAIPLCFDCHAKIGHYNDEQPRGTKYKPEELKARREQVYEEFTRHLVPPIHYGITNLWNDRKTNRKIKMKFPDVGFNLVHYGDSLPVRVRCTIEVLREDQSPVKMSKHYGGEVLWNLNPRFVHNGHFQIPSEFKDASQIRCRTSVTIIDQYEREHNLLPTHDVYVRNGDYWYFDT